MGDGPLPDRRRRVLIAVDFLVLCVAVLTVEWLWRGAANLTDVLPRALLAVLVLQVCLYYGELYEDRALRSRVELLLRAGRSLLAGGIALALLYYLFPALGLPQGTLVLFLPLALPGILGWHAVYRWIGGRQALIENVLILGTGQTAQQIAVEMLRREPLGYRVVGFLGEHPDEVGSGLVNPSVVGVVDDLLLLVESLGVTLVVVALDDRRGRLPVDDLLRCRTGGIEVEDAPSFFERLTGKILVADLRPSWLVFSPGFRKPRFERNVRRAAELVASLALLLLTAPLVALLMLLIRLESPGSVLFRQERIGARGRTFTIYKLRTMKDDAESASGPIWSSGPGDPRVTRVGSLLRKLRLDELPQLVNVLKGEMSFVGPRPERPYFVEQLRKVIPFYDERHSVRPGITGWAQVKFGYGSTIEDSERKLQFDLYYIKNMSLLLDLAIVADTLKVMLFGRGAR